MIRSHKFYKPVVLRTESSSNFPLRIFFHCKLLNVTNMKYSFIEVKFTRTTCCTCSKRFIGFTEGIPLTISRLLVDITVERTRVEGLGLTPRINF